MRTIKKMRISDKKLTIHFRGCEKTLILGKRIVSLSGVEDSQFFVWKQIKQNPSTTLRMTFLFNLIKMDSFHTACSVNGR